MFIEPQVDSFIKQVKDHDLEGAFSEVDIVPWWGEKFKAQQFSMLLAKAMQSPHIKRFSTWNSSNFYGSTYTFNPITGAYQPGDALPLTVDYQKTLAQLMMEETARKLAARRSRFSRFSRALR